MHGSQSTQAVTVYSSSKHVAGTQQITFRMQYSSVLLIQFAMRLPKSTEDKTDASKMQMKFHLVNSVFNFFYALKENEVCHVQCC